MKIETVGIYGVEDTWTGNIYVGQSTDIAKRWSNHTTNLKNGEHKYIELQEAYNLDCSRIKWTILEECREEELEEREDVWIKFIEKIDGWTLINKQKFGSASRKVKDTSNMCKAQTGENNGHNTKLSVEDVKEIKRMLKKGVRAADIANKYKISDGHVWNIANGKRWASVKI